MHGFDCFAACHMWHRHHSTRHSTLLISRIESFRFLSFLHFMLELISFLPLIVINSLCIICCYANAARCLALQQLRPPATALALPLLLLTVSVFEHVSALASCCMWQCFNLCKMLLFYCYAIPLLLLLLLILSMSC